MIPIYVPYHNIKSVLNYNRRRRQQINVRQYHLRRKLNNRNIKVPTRDPPRSLWNVLTWKLKRKVPITLEDLAIKKQAIVQPRHRHLRKAKKQELRRLARGTKFLSKWLPEDNIDKEKRMREDFTRDYYKLLQHSSQEILEDYIYGDITVDELLLQENPLQLVQQLKAV